MEVDGKSLDSLIHTALYDTGGESVEGAFVDHWVSNASEALSDLEAAFEKQGFSRESSATIRAALSKPGCPEDAAVKMLTWLKRWTGPLIRELLEESDPAVRVTGVRAAGEVLGPNEWTAALEDPHPAVRRAAVETLNKPGRHISDVSERLLAMLDDPDPSVRAAAARRIGFLNEPAGGETLARLWRTDPSPLVGSAILEHVERDCAGYTGRQSVESLAGPAVTRLLIDALNLPDPASRRAAAEGMRRFCSPEAIEAMFERLLVEEDRDVRIVLLRNGGYSALGDRAFDVLTGILDSSRDGAERTYAAFELPTFGERAVEPLLAALKDPNGPRRAAAMSLGSVGSLRILPDLLRAIQDPANAHYDREIDSAIRSVCAVDGEPGAMPNPSEAARARIQTRIRALTPDSPHGYGSRLCRDDLNSLPIHTAHLYLWSVRPDGTMLCSDFDKFAIPTEEETDPVNRFAVMVHGAMLYPELADLIPNPPRLIYLCHCRGRGWLPEESGTVECSFCMGMGWFHRPVDHAAAATS